MAKNKAPSGIWVEYLDSGLKIHLDPQYGVISYEGEEIKIKEKPVLQADVERMEIDIKAVSDLLNMIGRKEERDLVKLVKGNILLADALLKVFQHSVPKNPNVLALLKEKQMTIIYGSVSALVEFNPGDSLIPESVDPNIRSQIKQSFEELNAILNSGVLEKRGSGKAMLRVSNEARDKEGQLLSKFIEFIKKKNERIILLDKSSYQEIKKAFGKNADFLKAGIEFYQELQKVKGKENPALNEFLTGHIEKLKLLETNIRKNLLIFEGFENEKSRQEQSKLILEELNEQLVPYIKMLKSKDWERRERMMKAALEQSKEVNVEPEIKQEESKSEKPKPQAELDLEDFIDLRKRINISKNPLEELRNNIQFITDLKPRLNRTLTNRERILIANKLFFLASLTVVKDLNILDSLEKFVEELFTPTTSGEKKKGIPNFTDHMEIIEVNIARANIVNLKCSILQEQLLSKKYSLLESRTSKKGVVYKESIPKKGLTTLMEEREDVKQRLESETASLSKYTSAINNAIPTETKDPEVYKVASMSMDNYRETCRKFSNVEVSIAKRNDKLLSNNSTFMEALNRGLIPKAVDKKQAIDRAWDRFNAIQIAGGFEYSQKARLEISQIEQNLDASYAKINGRPQEKASQKDSDQTTILTFDIQINADNTMSAKFSNKELPIIFDETGRMCVLSDSHGFETGSGQVYFSYPIYVDPNNPYRGSAAIYKEEALLLDKAPRNTTATIGVEALQTKVGELKLQ